MPASWNIPSIFGPIPSIIFRSSFSMLFPKAVFAAAASKARVVGAAAGSGADDVPEVDVAPSDEETSPLPPLALVVPLAPVVPLGLALSFLLQASRSDCNRPFFSRNDFSSTELSMVVSLPLPIKYPNIPQMTPIRIGINQHQMFIFSKSIVFCF
jgi:hypothetical protein